MKSITLCLFLALGLTACSDNQQEKIAELNKKNASKATDYIQRPLDQAKEAAKMAEERIETLKKDQD